MEIPAIEVIIILFFYFFFLWAFRFVILVLMAKVVSRLKEQAKSEIDNLKEKVGKNE